VNVQVRGTGVDMGMSVGMGCVCLILCSRWPVSPTC